MIRTFWILILLTAPTVSGLAQGPVLSYRYPWTLSYEDLSDILRRYPAMYALDYGTLGAPMLFSPWHLHPWELRAERDLVPLNRRGDGLFDPNLQPASELDTIRYTFLDGWAAGQFHFQTRSVANDTPYTEFQIREGYNGYGTVDVLHGQRMYRSMTLDVSGRLGWYNGLRPNTASRLVSLRGKVGFDVGLRWRAGITYAGSHDDADFPLVTGGFYTEREEAVFAIDEKDTVRTVLGPALRLYIRQDRENWGGAFHMREGLGGWVAQAHATLPRQKLLFRHEGSYAEIDYPGAPALFETAAGLFVQDSVDMRVVGVRVFASLRGEVVANDPRDPAWKSLPSGGIEGVLPLNVTLAAFAGVHYVDELWPVAWSHAVYRVANRPLLIAPVFADNVSTYEGRERGRDEYRKALAGMRFHSGDASIELAGMMVDRSGTLAEQFIQSDTVITSAQRYSANDGKFGMSVTAQVPLWNGLRLDSWVATQGAQQAGQDETHAFSRLYFEHAYFKAPLIVRAHISHEYLGRREAYSDRGSMTLSAANIAGFRLSATIEGVTLMWGVDNFLAQHYMILPGYKMIAREEYISVIWRLWL
jgi:hypothetical protein